MDTNLRAEELFSVEIQKAILAADYMVVVLSPDVNRDNPPSFVQRELLFATQEEIGKKVFAVKAAPCFVPVIIAGVTWLPFHSGDFAANFETLCAKIENVRAPVSAARQTLAIPNRRQLELAYLQDLAKQYGVWGKVYTDLSATQQYMPATPEPEIADQDVMSVLNEMFEQVEMAFDQYISSGHSADDDADKQPLETFASLTDAIGQVSRLALLGEPGCGKTTSLRCLAGLERPTSGRISIGDRVVTAIKEGIFVSPEKRQIGMVFQSYAIWPHMTVFENVAYPLRAMGIPRQSIAPRVNRVLQLVQLEKFGQRYSSQLSGGQQQRVALARSLVAEPTLLLFDEPLSNLDANLRIQMRLEIRELQKRLGFTGVYVTHDQAEALAIADRVAVMQGGLLRQIGTPREVYEQPADTFVAGFMGNTNLLKSTVRERANGETLVEIDGGFALRLLNAPPTSKGETVTISARPEILKLLPAGATKAYMTTWPAEIAFSTFIGDTIIYHARMGPHTVEIREAPDVTYEPGSSVLISVDPARCRLLRE